MERKRLNSSRLNGSKGLSTIVSTLLILLLVFVAIGILWVVVRNVIQSGSEQVSLGKFTLDLAIDQVQIQQDINQVTVKVERKSGAADYTGLKFIVSDGNNQETFDSNVTLLEDEKQYYRFTLASINVSNIQKIEIVPIFTLSSGKTSLGDVKATWTKEKDGTSSGSGVVIINVPDNSNSNIGSECTVDLNCTGIANSGNYCSTDKTKVLRNDYSYSCNSSLMCQSSQSITTVQTCQNGFECNSGICVEQSIDNSGIQVTAVENSSNDGHFAEYTLDNNLSSESRWSAEGDGEYLIYTLSGSATLNKIQVASYNGDQRKNSFSVYVSSDKSNWNKVLDANTSGNNLGLETFTFASTSGKYVKLVGHGNVQNGVYGDWNSYTEVKIQDFSSTVSVPVVSNPTPTPTCSDGIQNQDETGIDCGGSCSACSTGGNNGGTTNAAGGLNEGKCDSNTGAVIVFSENWDNTNEARPWPYFVEGWWNDQYNGVVNVGGSHGKVLRVNLPKGTVGSGSGMGSRAFLANSYKELYLSFDYYIQNGFDYGGGGKFFGGLGGGREPTVPHQTVNEGGWNSMQMFKSGKILTYNYFDNTNTPDQWFYDPNAAGLPNGGYWPNGNTPTTLVQGQWHNYAVRIKMNDPGQDNGIYEMYDNGKMVYQLKQVNFNTDAHQDWWIDYIILDSFFGGSEASPKDQYMQFDNLEAFYYPKGNPNYRSGASEAGRTIQIPTAISGYQPIPPNIFKETDYTEKSGTIVGHCGFEIGAQHYGFQTSTIHVQGASHIDINVNKFTYSNEAGGGRQILNIYQGTGSSKSLKKTFVYPDYTHVSTMVSVSGNSATIEWEAGKGTGSRTFSLDYTSDGVGSGTNFKCDAGYAVAEEYNNLATCS